MFGDNSDGFANETEIVTYLNTIKFFDNLNTNFKSFLSFLFDTPLDGMIVSAFKPTGQVKPDIAITINGITKYISVKKGSGNSVHQEQLALFVSFLSCSSISAQTITYLREFHYGDGSTDGNGGTRINAVEWQAQNLNKVTQINSDLNTDIMLYKLFDRFLFIGNLPNAPVVDAIYHGNLNEGLWANRSEIIYHLLSKSNTATTIHFSSLTYQVWNRNLNYNPKTTIRRHVMQIKWPSLTDDLLQIKRKRN